MGTIDLKSMLPAGTGALVAPPVIAQVCRSGQWSMIGTPLPEITSAHLSGCSPDDEVCLLVETIAIARLLTVQIPPLPRRRAKHGAKISVDHHHV